MIKKLSFAIALLLISTFTFAQSKVVDTKVENLTNPIGIDIAKPVFSWKLQSDKRNVMQAAYEIKVATDASTLGSGKNLLWTSGKVDSDKSLYVPYAGPGLTSGEKYFWQVRVWDNSGKASAWSSPSSWQMGMLNKSDWKAKWISPAYREDSINRPSPLMRKTFQSNKKIQSATAYITSLGLYEGFINGKRIGDAYLTPGWTNYAKRIQYQQYDVTNLLAQGNNAVGVTLGSGWYRGYIGFSGQKNFYGKELALLFQLDIRYTDGTSEQIVSDESWKSATGDIVSSEIYHGETIDHQKEKAGWNTTNFNDSGWSGVKTINQGFEKLLATYNEPIKKHETFKPIKVFKTPAGEQVIDFGQNLVGWVQVKATGKAGDKITLYHAEVLDKKGNFYTENLRPAKQQNNYILKGGAEETFEPHFTFQGFRYIRIEGYPGEIKPENFTAIALYSDMKPTGKFTSSNALINQLQHNIQWGQRGNFLDVPTDCPQRDERLGWTGDAQAFARTASYNFDVKNFFSKWLKDLASEQVNGGVPFVVPNVITWGSSFAGNSAGWADAATIIPWDMYLAYGDKRILEDQYESMKGWVGYMERSSKNDLWNTGFHFGDWLFYRPFDDNDGRSAVTDKYLIAQCFFAHSTQLVINAAKVLEKNDDVEKYSALLKRVKDAYNKEYVTGTGRLVSGTQTAYVLALNFDMLPESQRKQAADRLVENVKSYGNHLSTGFLGTPYLCHVLSRFGHDEVAYALLEQESYPSWLYPVKMGATTIWERWDGIKPDSTFQTPGMNSFNHYAYGAIGDWMYRVVAGVDTDPSAPGYKSIVIKPHIGGKLTSASAEYETKYGFVKSSWKIGNGKLNFDVEIPANTTAVVYIPTSKSTSILESQKALNASKELKVKGVEGNYTAVELGSGKYQFTADQ
jgi:alpha-L-rhamnosidase